MFAKITPNTQILGQNILYFETIDSTQDFLKELLSKKEITNGTVVVCEYQSLGHGQKNRKWQSEEFSNLLFSFYIENVTKKEFNPFLLNKLAVLCMIKTLREYNSSLGECKIKWPNDVYFNQKKICGILTENTFLGKILISSVIGIGLNVNESFEKSGFPFISISEITQKNESRERILQMFLENFDIMFTNFITEDNTRNIEYEYKFNLIGFDKFCKFNTEKRGEFEAKNLGCNAFGQLMVEFEGQVEIYNHGDIKQIL